MPFPASIQSLINHFSNLPGIGPKTAERLVFYLLKQDSKTLADFSQTLSHIKDNIKKCSICGNLTDLDPCSICSDPKRDKTTICIIAEPADILPLEKSGEFHGVYHVLGGVLNPTEGITPDKLNIKELEKRISASSEKNNRIKEIILALNPTIEGETTCLYLTKLLKKYNIKITKLARGLPQGSDLEYADEVTLANAFRGRTQIH